MEDHAETQRPSGKATFDRVLTLDGHELTIDLAAKGEQGYKCIGCGAEMRAWNVGERPSLRITPHFKHFQKADDQLCPWSNELVRHKMAKKYLLELKETAVPLVRPVRPFGYEGKLPELAPATTITAPLAYAERVVFEDENGSIRLCKELDFDERGGKRRALFKPDVIFLDDQHNIILCVEFCATHKVDDKKLADIKATNLNAIEIRVPPTHRPDDIKKLFLTVEHRQTVWLHHKLQTQYPFTPDDTARTGAKNYGLAGNEDDFPEYEYADRLECRTHEVRGIVHRLRKILETNYHQSREGATQRIKAFIEEQASQFAVEEIEFDERRNRLFAGIDAEISTRAAKLRAEQEEFARYFERLRQDVEREIRQSFAPDFDRFREEKAGIENRRNRLNERYKSEQKRLDAAIEDELFGKAGAATTNATTVEPANSEHAGVEPNLQQLVAEQYRVAAELERKGGELALAEREFNAQHPAPQNP